jgi:hypothetical protein
MTAAAAELTSELLADLVERAARPDFGRFEAQLRSSNNCARPVRLHGRVEHVDSDGRRRVWSTHDEPDGVLRKACGNRREAVCPPCAERYRFDAYHLIAAGLRGGKGVPDTVTKHPAVFVTLTAPSFGAVHTRRLDANGQPRRCRPRRDAPVCEHGVRLSCGELHVEDDPRLGEPLCSECFDYRGALIWNNALPVLWRRFRTYLPRVLARMVGVTQAHLNELVRPDYVKVAEYQRRGLVHVHVVIRLDRAMPRYRTHEIKPPRPQFTAELLERAVRATVKEASAPASDGLGRVRWGEELDVDRIGGNGLDPRRCAGYLAKYATKSTEQAGGITYRVTEHEVDELPVREHVRTYLHAAFALASNAALADRRFDRYAHAFGYRGQCLTKSRRYSTTFKALRQAREDHVHAQLAGRAQLAERRANLRCVGIGHDTAADALLAASAAARARERRLAARDELRSAAFGEVKSRREAG